MKCESCWHKDACAAWIRHGETLYDDFEYTVEDCPYYNEVMGFNEQTMYLYWKTFFHGASAFMKYMHDYYNYETPVFPSEMENILIEFCKQFGEVSEVRQNEKM